MLNDYLDQLKSSNPEVRREAIIALGKLKDPAALGALADIYRNDPDPELRDLALKAGRYIRSAAADTHSATASTATPATPSLDSDANVIETMPEVPVKASNVEKAKGYFNQALDFQVRNMPEKAIEALGKAIEANPNLRNDSMFVNLAMDVTNMGSGAAIRMLSDPLARREFIQSGTADYTDLPKPKRKGKPQVVAEEVSWGAALIDLTIYALVNGALVFIGALVAFEALMTVMFTAMPAAAGMQAPGVNTMSVSLPVALLYGLVYGVFQAIGLLIYDTAVHIVATTVMGGAGTLAGLVRKTTIFFTILIPIGTLIQFLPLLALNNPDLDGLFQAISLLFFGGALVYSGTLTGRAYQFGTMRGCVSIFVGVITLIVLSVCCVFALGSTLAQIVQNTGGF